MTDETAVAHLIARVAQLADDGDLDAYVDCFTPDARWDMPGGPRRGHAEILAGGEERRRLGTGGPGSQSRHVVNTIVVSVSGDRAEAASYWQFYVSTATTPTVQVMGKYDDTFLRSESGWKLDHRRITIG
jgi:uncharacterized protein (TIGR02246 family)